jgi:hypothetical protein
LFKIVGLFVFSVAVVERVEGGVGFVRGGIDCERRGGCMEGTFPPFVEAEDTEETFKLAGGIGGGSGGGGKDEFEVVAKLTLRRVVVVVFVVGVGVGVVLFVVEFTGSECGVLFAVFIGLRLFD